MSISRDQDQDQALPDEVHGKVLALERKKSDLLESAQNGQADGKEVQKEVAKLERKQSKLLAGPEEKAARRKVSQS